MMISKAQIQQVMRQYGETGQVNKAKGSGEASAVKRNDSVVLSKEALHVQQMQKYLAEGSEVREEKVRVLAEQIRSGSYNVSGEEIAEQMIGRIIVDRVY